MLNLNTIVTTSVNAATGSAIQRMAAIATEKLCQPVCQNQGIQPTARVVYSLVGQHTVGTTTFVDLLTEGIITYVPKGAGGCCVKQKQFVEKTTLVFSNASATHPVPTIALVQGESDGSLAELNCDTAKAYQIATELTVTATWA